MLCINSILHFNMHLLLCTLILCINLVFRFGAHKLRLGSMLPLAHIYYHDQDNDLMSWSCVNCSNAVIDLYITLYLRDVYGNESCQMEIELNWFRWWLGAVKAAQAIACAIIDPDHGRHMESLGHNVLICARIWYTLVVWLYHLLGRFIRLTFR